MFSEFKPIGVRGKDLKQIVLTLDEFEAFRLADQLGFSHAMAAEEMKISRSTFSRLIEKARKKTADFIMHGRMLIIEGGSVHFRINIIHCEECKHFFRMNFEQDIKECPECHSTRITNIAGNFGHGRCCIQNENALNT
jgi:predicted DNA-binding protein (UPF0251 family)